MSNFEQTINRKNTGSVKWDTMGPIFGIEDTSDILPMWIADMDFSAPQPVVERLQKCLDFGVFGYTYFDDECKEAVRNWINYRHNWEVKDEWMLVHHGVVPAMASTIETLTSKHDNILVMAPVYPPFSKLPDRLERNLIEYQMEENDGAYSINFENLESYLRKDVKLFLFCNPHNPGGIVWSKKDLQRIIDLCTQYDVIILSDEIHADLTLSEARYTPLASIAGKEKDRVISCVAPTKTFNLAGIQLGITITSNMEIKEKLENNIIKHGQMGVNRLSPFAASALKAAYQEGEPWLEQLLQVISSNMNYVIKELNEKLPEIRIRKPQATYLMWIDYRKTGLSEDEIMKKLLHRGKVALEPGTKYGAAGVGFLRMNVACSPAQLKEAVRRFIIALS